MLEIGVRVVRGPDWKWGVQDDGEGHCGTVVELGKAGSLTSPDKTVVVQWDSGSRTNYRVGYQNAFDLLVVDNAPAGVKHAEIICDGCSKHGIPGIRWNCEACVNYDLCTHCYMTDTHDLNHRFRRFETPDSVGLPMPPRSGCLKLQLKGVFVGAKVVRGPDWVWNDQDGGEGKTGRVIDIRGWDNESGRSVANVMWTSGNTNVYRLGHNGKVDLKYVEDAVGGFYYKDHLPVLGVQQENVIRAPGSSKQVGFKCGDKVKILVKPGKLEEIQKNFGFWNEKLKDFIGKVGIVHRLGEKGEVKVTFEGCNDHWSFHPTALTKVNVFAVGDTVRLSADEKKVKVCQVGHGFWIDPMKSSLGKWGKVIQIYKDGDLRVCFKNSQTWTLNPACVTLVSSSHTEQNNSMQASSNHRDEHANPLASLLSSLRLGQEPDSTNMDKLVREAAHGHLDAVKDFIGKFPGKVNGTSSGKTCLQVACHQGHRDMVQFLLDSGADLAIADQDGDTALHYSAFGDQAEVIEILLRHGADINAVNQGSCSALHIAVNKQHARCVRKLLEFKCDVNIQDSYGDTALHDAIGKDSVEITDLLCSYEGVDFALKNKRGFNALHQAALRGNNVAAEKLIERARELVDAKKDDGFAALHLACLNGHKAVAETLIAQGGADINLQNNRKQTPLLLAASQGRCSVLELLVSMKADVHAIDEEGESALHLVLIKRANISSEITAAEAPIIHTIHSEFSSGVTEHSVALAIACYLVQEGCSLTLTNSKGKTPLQLVDDNNWHLVLSMFETPREVEEGETEEESEEEVETVQTDEKEENGLPECSVCSEVGEQNVLFEPCGHKIACEDCASRVKKCLKCGAVITKKIANNGKVIHCRWRNPSAERMRDLEKKIQEIEDAQTCYICMERKKNVVFLCGHSACDYCCLTLKNCHMCREPITRKINLY